MRSVFAIELPKLTQYVDRKGELDRYLPCIGDTEEIRLDLALSAELEHPHEHPEESEGLEILEQSARSDGRGLESDANIFGARAKRRR